MTGHQLEAMARGAYGPHWKRALARDAGIDRNTLSRWARGKTRIRERDINLIRQICLSAMNDRTRLAREALRAVEKQISYSPS
jgi:transcriptional regulator with XRE-family HTH domain